MFRISMYIEGKNLFKTAAVQKYLLNVEKLRSNASCVFIHARVHRVCK